MNRKTYNGLTYVLSIWEKVIQEVQLSRREASNVNGIWLLSVLCVGCLQQDEVGPAHQVQVVRHRQVRGGATHLPPLLPGQFIVVYCSIFDTFFAVVYPNSQVAELGGTFGLFVGFSFCSCSMDTWWYDVSVETVCQQMTTLKVLL